MKLNSKFNGRYIEGAGGARLFVEENGDPTKPTILWIHGYSQCRLSWDNQFENEDLVSKFHMIRLARCSGLRTLSRVGLRGRECVRRLRIVAETYSNVGRSLRLT